MTTDETKRVASELFARFTASDLAGALDLLADDATWWIAGASPAAGDHTKEEIAAVLRRMAGQLEDGLRMTVKGTIAEGDRVAVEVESYGTLKNGRVYNNHYHFAMTIRDGRIAEIREYLDTQHVVETWYRPDA